MCSLCGALGQGPAWEQGGVAGDEARWRLHREAAETAGEVTRLLASSRIRVRAHPDFGFLVAFPTGATEMVTGLGDLWHLLDRRGIAIPDPLDV